jgi:hypothetical protein
MCVLKTGVNSWIFIPFSCFTFPTVLTFELVLELDSLKYGALLEGLVSLFTFYFFRSLVGVGVCS